MNTFTPNQQPACILATLGIELGSFNERTSNSLRSEQPIERVRLTKHVLTMLRYSLSWQQC